MSRKVTQSARQLQIRNAGLLSLCAIGLAACGGSDSLRAAPLDELVREAAAGDTVAMAELERRAEAELRSQNEATPTQDPEAVFQSALFSGDVDAVDTLAANGNAFAQTHVAIMLSSSPSLSDADAARARQLLESAADAQHSPAIFRMSEDHLANGKLFPLDEAKAFNLAVEAAELGLGEAMYQTGIRYQYGLLTAPQDDGLATDWLEKAKAAGDRDAQRQLDELSIKSDK